MEAWPELKGAMGLTAAAWPLMAGLSVVLWSKMRAAKAPAPALARR